MDVPCTGIHFYTLIRFLMGMLLLVMMPVFNQPGNQPVLHAVMQWN